MKPLSWELVGQIIVMLIVAVALLAYFMQEFRKGNGR